MYRSLHMGKIFISLGRAKQGTILYLFSGCYIFNRWVEPGPDHPGAVQPGRAQ
jgi:hypothetical protein